MAKKRWRGSKPPAGVSVVWSPTNRAWLIMWHEEVVGIVTEDYEVEYRLRDMTEPDHNPGRSGPSKSAKGDPTSIQTSAGEVTIGDIVYGRTNDFGAVAIKVKGIEPFGKNFKVGGEAWIGDRWTRGTWIWADTIRRVEQGDRPSLAAPHLAFKSNHGKKKSAKNPGADPPWWQALEGTNLSAKVVLSNRLARFMDLAYDHPKQISNEDIKHLSMLVGNLNELGIGPGPLRHIPTPKDFRRAAEMTSNRWLGDTPKRYGRPMQEWTEADFLLESGGELGRDATAEILRGDLEDIILDPDLSPGELYRVASIVKDAFSDPETVREYLQAIKAWDEDSEEYLDFPDEGLFRDRMREQILSASPDQILGYVDAAKLYRRVNPTKLPGWIKTWLKTNGTGLARKTGARIKNVLGCGHWGCVFDSKYPEWVVKVTLDPAEGPLVKKIMQERAERDGGGGKGPGYSLAGIVFYNGLFEGGTVRWRGKDRTVYVIVRERVEPIRWSASWRRNDPSPQTFDRQMLMWHLYETSRRLDQALLAARNYHRLKDPGRRSQSHDKYRDAIANLRWAPFVSETMMELDYDLGIVLSDVHQGNLGIATVDWEAKGAEVARGSGAIVISDLVSWAQGVPTEPAEIQPMLKRLARGHR